MYESIFVNQLSEEVLAPFPAGSILDQRFEVRQVVGQGGAGVVYRAIDREQGGREVALKVLSDAQAFDEHTLERFREELRICRSLRHPNLVEAYDLIEDGTTVAYTMEFVRGSNLAQVMRRDRLSASIALAYIDQLLAALAELHKHGIVHRDVKLENLLVREDGVLKLGDLGLMKSPNLQGLTRTGVLLGTAQYMPPEYIRHSHFDHRGDLYAVGAVLMELLTGVRRLADKRGNEVIEHLLKTKFEVARTTLNGVPRAFIPVIERALDPEPANRYQSAEHMRQALRSAAAENVSGGVKLGSTLALADFAQQHRIRRRSGVLQRGLLVAALSACFVVVLAPGMYRWALGFGAQHTTLIAGRYEGTFWLQELPEATSKLHVEVSSGEATPVAFHGSLPECPGSVLDLATSRLSCAQGRYAVSGLRSDGHTVEGLIVDTVEQRRYPFVLTRIRAESAHAESLSSGPH